jgi:CRISPR-associated protein Cas1
MSTLYLTEQRSLVRREAEYLVVLIPDNPAGSGKRRVEVPLIKIDQVVVQGDVTFTAPALHALLDARIEISFLSSFGQFKGRLEPQLSKNALLRIEQHRAHQDPEKRLAVAREFVRGKLSNMRTMLLRQNRKLREPEVQRGAERLKSALDALGTATTVASLVGMEGAGSAAYFGLFARLLRQELGFRRRIRRPPTDPVNALLS